MAPYDFDALDADAILRSPDGKELRVHRIILSLTSPVFQGMFSLPQSVRESSQIPIVDVPESSDILEPFLQCLYPRSPPKISDLTMWTALYTTADKYGAEVVMDFLRDLLISRFLETSPLRVYALASHWGLEEEARIASTKTLAIDVSKDLPQEDAELMGGAACRRLYLLHLNRRAAARALVTDHPLPSPNGPFCKCPPLNDSGFITALCERVATRPWLTSEDVNKEVVEWHFPGSCGWDCRHSIRNMHVYFASLLEKISDLPRTI